MLKHVYIKENFMFISKYIVPNEPNMFLMRKHEKSQSLVFIGVQTSEKMPKRHFIKHLARTL